MLTIGDYDGTDPFQHCSGDANSFPQLADSDGRAHPIGQELPADKLFDPKLGKIIVIGKGRRIDDGVTYTTLVDVHWELTLKRIKGHR